MKAIVQEQFKTELYSAKIAIAEQDFEAAMDSPTARSYTGANRGDRPYYCSLAYVEACLEAARSSGNCWATHANTFSSSHNAVVWTDENSQRR